jgi:hypothetical protein
MSFLRSITTVLGALFLLGAVVAPAMASDAEDIRARLNEARVHLAELQADENADSAAREMGYADIDADEVADRLTNHMTERAEVAIIRLENRVKLIEALIQQAIVDALAADRETASIAMTREADQAQVAYEATEARRSALREQVGGILNQLEVEQ